ncbi:MAG: hypothetical protein ABH810_02670 [bacterium]
MGEVPGPPIDDEDENGVLGKDIAWSHPPIDESAEAVPPSEENNPDVFSVHGMVTGRETENLPAGVLFLKLKIALRRMQGKSPTTEADAEKMRTDLKLASDSIEKLADRVRAIPEELWHEKPIYLTAVYYEWKGR